MPSMQEPAAGSKSAKFVSQNPLDPMIKPFEEGLNDDQKDYQQALAENVNNRLTKAMDELVEKHRQGTNEVDDPDRAPTGPVYRQLEQEQLAAWREKRRQELQQRQAEMDRMQALKSHVQAQVKQGQNIDDDKDEEDSDDDDLLDDDPAIEAIRQRRLQELREAQIKKAEDIARGHGQYRTISQDEFLPECTGSSEYVAVHFFHKDFVRCQIMDHHLKLIAEAHTTCKFLRIDAEKAPFFVSKLNIRTLPTLLVFQNGKSKCRLTGFEGLVADPKEPDKWETWRLEEWLARTAGAIQWTPPSEEMRQEMERLGIRTSLYRGGISEYDEDDE